MAISPPITQARIESEGLPAARATSPDYTKIPDPIVVPTAIAKAAQKPSFLVSAPLFMRVPPNQMVRF
jgi:hypothetical protein